MDCNQLFKTTQVSWKTMHPPNLPICAQKHIPRSKYSKLTAQLTRKSLEDFRFSQLAEHLESLAGGILVPEEKGTLDALLSRGLYWGPPSSEIEAFYGSPGHCHTYTGIFWDTNRDKTLIATGYALGPDGQWLRHSWLVRPKKKFKYDLSKNDDWIVVETTWPWRSYFGFILSFDECKLFLRSWGLNFYNPT